jgi:hypothetical protein
MSIGRPLPRPSEEDIVQQSELITAAKNFLGYGPDGVAQNAKRRKRKGFWRQDDEEVNMRDVVEAWNLADTEAWRFVRSYDERARMVHKAWLEGEKIYEADVGRRAWW